MVCIDAHVHVFARMSAEFPREASSMCPAENEALLTAAQRAEVMGGTARRLLRFPDPLSRFE